MPMNASNVAVFPSGTSYLVSQFRAFYAELIAVKKQVEVRRPSEALQAPDTAAGSDLAMAQSISRQLLGVLELQAIEARRAGGSLSFDINREAQYIMAALADESLLRVEWAGRDVWTTCLIEESLFESRVAGDLFFERLDELLRTRDPARQDLALIYLLALSLGFEGRYRGTDCAARMRTYRAALYRLRFAHDPDPTNYSRQIAPHAYGFTVGDAVPEQVPHVGRWVMIFLLVMLGILGLSQVLWEWKAGPLVQNLKVTGK